MRFSIVSQNEANSLLLASRMLITSLNKHDAAGGDINEVDITSAVAVVERYVNLLSDALVTCSRDDLLRAANLLTTVSKGLTDTLVISRASAALAQGFVVSRQLIGLASRLRDEQ